MGPPRVEHEHIKHVQLLRKSNRFLCLNDGPFRVLHAIAFATFTYCVLTYIPPDDPGAASTDSDDPIAAIQDESLDGVFSDESGGEIPEVYEMWEPETPQDYVRVAWAILTIFHVLINLFCIWTVRVKRFCQFGYARSVEYADHVLCIPHQNHGNPDIVPLCKREINHPTTGESVRVATSCGADH